MTGLRDRPIQRYGDAALLVDVPDLDAVLALHAGLVARPAPGQVDVVPAARTVLVKLSADADLDAAIDYVRTVGLVPPTESASRQVDIDVVYDGEDLAEVGELTGLGVDGVVATHTEATWTVAFGGFAPGFGYLVTDTDGWSVPRRSTPRTRIPAGAVGLAGPYSGVYPQASPGGWQLIGRTDAPLWRTDRDPPALLSPGTSVRFHQVDELPPGDPTPPPGIDHGSPPTSGLRIVDPGPLTTVQDLGRVGLAALGVPVSGAADRSAAVAANQLVGNPPDAAVLEITLGRARLEAVGDQLIGLGGAVPMVRIDDPTGTQRSVDPGSPFTLPAGAVLRLGGARVGLRTYVAVAGGLDVAPVLGSRSTDTLSGLGPPRPAKGDLLPVGRPTSQPIGDGSARPPQGDSTRRRSERTAVADTADTSTSRAPDSEQGGAVAGDETTDDHLVIRVDPGPRLSWFAPDALDVLVAAEWTVLPDSDRVGVRLEAEADLDRVDESELPSEGLVAGAIQIPPSGKPVVFLADHPVTGGYPVIAVVRAGDLSRVAQARPGNQVRLRLA